MPGYRLIAPLGRGGFGEVWKCLAPGGLHKAIKFVGRDADGDDPEAVSSLRQESDAFEHVKSIRHPFLLTLERVEWIDGDLVMVMELADRSLGHRYDECREEGLPGIPRRELLSYMVDAAEALDVLSAQHGLQHLDVKPANLFLLGGHVKVGDYGLVTRLRANRDGESHFARGLTPKYVAPEILCDRVDARSDQYPLALVYQELLTGAFPYGGRTAQQLLLQHASAEPDLSELPAGDRGAVARALAKDPADRFPSCLSFVKALLRDETAMVAKTVPSSARQTPIAGASGSLYRSGGGAIEATQRLNPSLASVVETWADSRGAAEFNRRHPDWKFVAEGPHSPFGRIVRATDASGQSLLVHSISWLAGDAVSVSPVVDALWRPAVGLAQSIHRQSASLSIAIPEQCPTLKVWLATRKPEIDTHLKRSEYRALLAPVAAALDALHGRHGFPHALLSPSVVVREGATWGIALYGLGELLQRTRSDRDWIASEPYAAPEAIDGRAVVASDQYSLGLIYLELRGVCAPAERRGTRVDRRGVVGRVDRDALTEAEWVAVKKATAPNPEHRYPSCAAFLAALEPARTNGVTLEAVRAVEGVDRLCGRGAAPEPPHPEYLAQVLLLAAGAGAVASWPSPKSERLITRLPDGRLIGRFPVKLSVGSAASKLIAFRAEHRLDLTQWTRDTFALKPKPGSSMAGRGVELVVQWPEGDPVLTGECVVTGRALGYAGKSELDVIGLIEQFCRTVQNIGERRKSPRFRTDQSICVYPIDDELAVRTAIPGICRDVSASGFSCILPKAIPTGHAFVSFPSIPEFSAWALIAAVVRSRAMVDGGVAVAGRFIHAGA